MKKIYFYLAVVLIMFFYTTGVHPLEIPLSISPGASSSDEEAAKPRQFRIAYADMELIYNVCPQRTRASNEYRAAKEKFELNISSISAALDKRKQDLEMLEKEISELRLTAASPSITTDEEKKEDANMNFSSDTISSSQRPHSPSGDSESTTVISTAQVKGVEAIYEKEITRKSLLAEIDKLSAELNVARDTMNKELSAMEKQCATSVLEDLYKVLQKIAAEEELILIIDKNYILYAPETYDITHKVIERLK